MNVGQGEAIVIDLPDDSFMLLDGGPHADAAAVLDAIDARVKQGRRFRLAGITQWDADHIRGIPAVLAQHRPLEFRVPGLGIPLLEKVARHEAGGELPKLMRTLLDAIRALPSETLHWFSAGSRIDDLGAGVDAHVLSPGPTVADAIHDALDRSTTSASSVLESFRNRASVVLWIRFGGRTLLLAGEAEADQYRTMDAYFLRPRGALVPYMKDHAADWIKLSHHGADGNNPDDLFKFFGRAGFVGTASAGGGYTHPHPAALKRLHVDHGGRAMCTGLGKGCDRLLREKKLNPAKPDVWAEDLLTRSNPHKDCYGTITVTVTGDGRCMVRTSAVQKRCPYGGPANGKHAW